MNKVILDTEYSCTIKTEKFSKALSKDQYACIENETKISVCSLQKDFDIDLLSLQSCQNYTTRKFKDCTYITLTLPTQICEYDIKKISLKNKSLELKISHKNIIAKTPTKEFDIPIAPYLNYEITKTENFVFVKFLSKNNEKMIVFCAKSDKIYTFSAKEIILSENNIVTKSANFSKIYTLGIDNIIEQKSTQNMAEYINEKTLAMVFLNCVQKKQYAIAKSFLANSLQQKSESALFAFFGNINKIVPIAENSFLVFDDSSAKVFNFCIQNNKIVDIDAT